MNFSSLSQEKLTYLKKDSRYAMFKIIITLNKLQDIDQFYQFLTEIDKPGNLEITKVKYSIHFSIIFN